MAQRGKYYARPYWGEGGEPLADICYYDHVPGDPPGILRPHYLVGGLLRPVAASFVDDMNDEAMKPSAARKYVADLLNLRSKRVA